MTIQLNLFKRSTAERALELASWLRIETADLRVQVKILQAALKKQESSLDRLEGMLTDLKQRELFEE
jgi:hypothetical protein